MDCCCSTKSHKLLRLVVVVVITDLLFPFFHAALVFNGNTNPVHPNSIGCIDSVCDVTEVARGKRKGVSGFVKKW